MTLEIILITLSSLLICSFFYNYLLEKFQIPSVLLLIATGIILKIISHFTYGRMLYIPEHTLAVFGTLGLITIVLEATLDLNITKHNRTTVGIAFISAAFTVIMTSLLIGLIIHWAYPMSFKTALLYATPLSIVSSAIVIPSVARLAPKVKEFLILESIFSDIVGILLFNFLCIVEFTSLHSWGMFSFSLLAMLILSVIVSIPLALIMNHSKRNHQHIFILAILILMYALAKYFHLSSLILILIFALILNHIPWLFRATRFKRLFNHSSMRDELNDMQALTGELAFIIRTFFFILFGYSINFSLLLNFKALLLGGLVICIVYLSRYLNFMIFRTGNRLLNTLIAPRGLITVLLFYQIPQPLQNTNFEEGIIFVIVILSSLIMSTELIFNKKNGG